MADQEHPVVKTDNKAMQAERSPNTFLILVISLSALAVVAFGVFWYFGVFDGMGAVQPKSAT
jgi:hypothetical protein